MRVQLFTFRYSSTLGGFDDTSLRDFTRDKEVLAFREHFFTVNDVPHVACVVTYQEPKLERAPAPDSGKETRSRRRTDPTAHLSEADRLLFNTLREWRAETARESPLRDAARAKALHDPAIDLLSNQKNNYLASAAPCLFYFLEKAK